MTISVMMGVPLDFMGESMPVSRMCRDLVEGHLCHDRLGWEAPFRRCWSLTKSAPRNRAWCTLPPPEFGQRFHVVSQFVLFSIYAPSECVHLLSICVQECDPGVCSIKMPACTASRSVDQCKSCICGDWLFNPFSFTLPLVSASDR